ncbi:MAG: hypothetical protein GWN67_17565 [Phycisphaerae bacterium]|nr:hypothetical protein [Phycisphaerae bacterium]NIP52911.1 hypothetical protein [Phycisphaerae bacterium]NIS51962.1 hypothetical protein [Phycisphaerae bacterium]NIU09476.1 hypothetical protein [Phycisphaerae bacterium]NIU58127.1 hypothetical protein [Phycisphaerae bacterium]
MYQHDDISQWNCLISKATKTSYLGHIGTTWRVINTARGNIRISLFNEKFLQYLICSISVLIALLLVLLLLTLFTKRPLSGKDSWYFVVPAIWLFFGLRFGYTRKLLWKRNNDKIDFIFGFYPFLKSVSLNKKYLSARLQWSNKTKCTKPIIYLYNSKYSDSCLRLVTATRRQRIVPVFDALSEILDGRCIDETTENK